MHLKFMKLELKKISAEEAYETQLKPKLKIMILLGKTMEEP